MKYINMSMMDLFYKVFTILEIKVALISYGLSNAASKAVENNELITVSPLLAVPWYGVGYEQTDDGYHCKHSYQGWLG